MKLCHHKSRHAPRRKAVKGKHRPTRLELRDEAQRRQREKLRRAPRAPIGPFFLPSAESYLALGLLAYGVKP